MTYDPRKHLRRSIRLKGYDYASPDHYFLNLCAQNRECRYGKIVDKKMILNTAGRMVDKWYYIIHNPEAWDRDKNNPDKL